MSMDANMNGFQDIDNVSTEPIRLSCNTNEVISSGSVMSNSTTSTCVTANRMAQQQETPDFEWCSPGDTPRQDAGEAACDQKTNQGASETAHADLDLIEQILELNTFSNNKDKTDETDDTPGDVESGYGSASNREKGVDNANVNTARTCKEIRVRIKQVFCGDAAKVVLTRVLFLLHALLTIWRVTVVLGDKFWISAALTVTFVIDAVFVIVKRKGKEWTWFQPIVLMYLLVVVPGIWFLELEKVSGVQVSYNQTAILGDLYGGNKATKFNVHSVKVELSKNTWALVLEQSMLVLIIIARWLMPKGALSKDQLSGLLLSYLGTASDVVDFFSVLAEEEKLLKNLLFVFTILSVWSWSMIQFVFVVTMTKTQDADENKNDTVKVASLNRVSPHASSSSSRQPSSEHAHNDRQHPPVIVVDDADDAGQRLKTGCAATRSMCHGFVESELWSIFVAVVLQDGPYVIVRLACVFYWNIRTYTNYFFTAKNCIMLSLQVYRMVALCEDERHKKARLGKIM